MFLAALGGAAGLALAALIQSGFEAWLPVDVPGLRGVRVDATMVLFTLGVAASKSVLFGLAPALQGTRTDISDALRGAKGGTFRVGSTAFHSGLLGAQAAIVVFLLIGAALLTQSAVLLTGRDAGFPIEGRSVFDVTLPGATYQNQPAVAEFAARLQGRLSELSEVARAALTTSLPFGNGGYNFPVWVRGELAGSIDERPPIWFEAVTPGYFPTLGVTPVSGRTFTGGHDGVGERVAVVNERLAGLLFGDRDPLGRMVSVSDASVGPWHRVVGVVPDLRYAGADIPPPRIYLPLAQVDWVLADLQAVDEMRNEARPVDGESVRRIMAELDPSLAISSLQSFSELRAQRLAHPRFRARLFGWFAALAVVLGTVGVYGVVGYSTQQRGRELRIRKALGADRFGLLVHVMLVGMRPVLIGIVVGIVAASLASRALGSFLVEISGTDPTTYAAAAALLVAVGSVACLIPGLRAAAVDPAGVLRSD
jgi:putative ABC transport system permease protein